MVAEFAQIVREASASASASASQTPGPIASAVAASVSNPPDAFDNLWDALQKWNSSTFELGFAGTVIYTLIVAAFTALGLWIVKRTVKERLTGNLHVFYVLLRALIIVIAATAVLTTITPLKDMGNALVASSGIASVIVGLAAQETLGNVFSGLGISISKPFIVGEYIELLETSPPIAGTVQEITLRQTVLKDANNKTIVIPNSVIDKEMIKRSPQHATTQQAAVNNFLDVGVSYSSNIDKAISILQELVAAQPEYLDQRSDEDIKNGAPKVTVRVQELAQSSVNLRAWVWTKNVGDGFVALSNLRLAVVKAFAQNGIEIPYPYRNVILKPQGAPKDAKNTVVALKEDQKTVS